VVFRLAAPCEGLDDDHAAATAAAWTRQHVGFVGGCGLGRLGLFWAGRHGKPSAPDFYNVQIIEKAGPRMPVHPS
jgi:hypothetical protein